MAARLREHYLKKVVPALTQEHGYKVHARKGYYALPKYQAMR